MHFEIDVPVGGGICTYVCVVRWAGQPQLMWQYLLHLVGFVTHLPPTFLLREHASYAQLVQFIEKLA